MYHTIDFDWNPINIKTNYTTQSLPHSQFPPNPKLPPKCTYNLRLVRQVARIGVRQSKKHMEYVDCPAKNVCRFIPTRIYIHLKMCVCFGRSICSHCDYNCWWLHFASGEWRIQDIYGILRCVCISVCDVVTCWDQRGVRKVCLVVFSGVCVCEW